MRKMLALFLCLVLVFGMTACASTTEEAPATPEEAPAAEVPAAPAAEAPTEGAPAEETNETKVWERIVDKDALDQTQLEALLGNSAVYNALQSGKTGLELVESYGAQEPVVAGRADAVPGEGQGRKIALLVDTIEQMAFRLLITGASDAVREGDELLVYNYEQDAEKALDIMETCIANEVDAFILHSGDPNRSVVWTQMAAEAGIPCFTTDQICADTTNVNGMVIGDNYGIGYYLGIQVAEKYYEQNGHRNATIMTYQMLDSVSNAVVLMGMEDALAEYGMGVTTNVEGNWLTEDALAPIEATYTGNPVYDVFVSFCDPPVIAAVQVFEELGVQDDIMVFAHECSYWVSQQMDAGIVHATSDASHYYFGYKPVQQIYDYLEGNVTGQIIESNALIPVYAEDYKDHANTYKIEAEIRDNWNFDLAS